MAGSVTAFALSPDGSRAVYIADQDTLGLPELYSTPVDGSAAPTKISAGLSFGAGDSGVRSFSISVDGSRVAFLADADLGGGDNDAYSAPIDGSAAPVRLSTAAQGPVTALGVSPSAAEAVFFGTGSGATEAYIVALGTAASGVRLSDAGNIPGGNVVFADFTPDGSSLIYAADAAVDGVFQWHSVSTSAGGPGADTVLSAASSFVSAGLVTSDSATLVYTADEDISGVTDLYSVPLTGGASTKLTPAMAGDGVTAIGLSADGTRVAYLADQVTAGVTEVFGAQTGVAGSGTRLNTPLAGTQSADVITVADGTLLYEADENTAGTFDLFAVPLDGSASPTTLHGMTPPDNAGSFAGSGTPIVASRAVYPVFGTSVDLYSVPFDGSASFVRINDMLAAGDNVMNAFVPSAATRLAAYGVGESVTEELFAAAIRADLAPEQVNISAVAGSLGVLGYEIASTEHYTVYVQDQDTAGKPELYSFQMDSDLDGVGNATDSCPFVSNPAQNTLVFGQTVFAENGSTFSWGTPEDVRYVRGPLASVASLAFDQSGILAEATSFTDSDAPVGGGFFYLFALDCPGRSYQTSIGTEPGRDSAVLP